jgi:hypothetical protein
MSSYGHSHTYEDGDTIGYTINLKSRKITFEYTLGEDCGFSFSLLSECRDDIQKELRKILDEDEIVLGIFDTESEYCNVVMFADLPWEDENGDIIS